ncbi:MAG: metal ABC transporter permease [Lachnospiraceae bacterium]|nr:metal ABC transporter permease [Lachnospiraceae bacterium]MBR6357813.1 metal ABC transporter permease [Lachnospiraceae bacterium]
MIRIIAEMLSYPFLVRALICGVLLSVCASLLGVSLVLKRYSMIGDGLSHVGFGALAIATAFHWAPLAVSIPVVVAAAFLLLRLNENTKIKGDAAIALISTGALAIGILVVSLTTGVNIDIYNYMFGSVLAIDKTSFFVSIGACAVIIVLFLLFYNRIFAVTFDEDFTRATQARSSGIHILIALLTAVVIVLGMRLMGALLISALIIFPALTSMRVFKSYKKVTVSAAILSAVCFVIGIFCSYTISIPVGATVVVINIIAFLIFFLIGKIRIHKQQ